MRAKLALSVFVPLGSCDYRQAGGGKKEFEIDTFEAAKEAAREWVRRNRAANAKYREIRYQVSVTCGDETWVHDETKDNPLLEPTESTVVACAP